MRLFLVKREFDFFFKANDLSHSCINIGIIIIFEYREKKFFFSPLNLFTTLDTLVLRALCEGDNL